MRRVCGKIFIRNIEQRDPRLKADRPSCIDQFSEVERRDLSFNSLEGVAASASDHVGSVRSLGKDDKLHLRPTEKLKTEVKTSGIFPNGPEISVIHQIYVRSSQLTMRGYKVNEVTLGRRVKGISCLHRLIFQQGDTLLDLGHQ